MFTATTTDPDEHDETVIVATTQARGLSLDPPRSY